MGILVKPFVPEEATQAGFVRASADVLSVRQASEVYL